MSNQEGDNPFWRDGEAEGDADSDRAAILARRKRFVAAALSSLSLGAAVADCTPTVCLSVLPEDAQTQTDARQAEAQACLSIARDEGVEPDAADSSPMPCLDIAPSDGGADGE